MTKNEALSALAIKKKITHVHFRPHEYFFQSSPGYYQFEDGAVIDTETFWKDRASPGFLSDAVNELLTYRTPKAIIDFIKNEETKCIIGNPPFNVKK